MEWAATATDPKIKLAINNKTFQKSLEFRNKENWLVNILT